MSEYPPPFDQSYKAAPAPAARQTGLKSFIIAKLQNPLFAIGSFLFIAGLFGALLVFSYPAEKDETALPVVKAEATPVKTVPESRGGMDIPHQDSTVFMSMRETDQAQKPKVERLLDDSQTVSEAPIDLTEAIIPVSAPQKTTSQKVESLLSELETELEQTQQSAEPVATPVKPVPEPAPEQINVAPDRKPPFERPVFEVRPLIQETEKVQPTALASNQKPMHDAASSPETLAFVRAVLEKTKTTAEENAAKTANNIEPAAGAAAPSGKALNKYYVQLGSVPTPTGAAQEWSRLQKSLGSELSGQPHRVYAANLGERGTFYRIQAGPYSKEEANALCGKIKARKPGGCLVVR